ncbi:MAG: ricin-type beta-trefoil lectin domain protein, partial [Endozoicomonas sp.]
SVNTMVTLQGCIEHKKSQGWRFDFSKKRLYFLEDKKHYCLTRGEATSGLIPCEDSDTQWVFNQDRTLGYKPEGQDSIEPLKLVDQETGRDHKRFRFQMFGSENGYHSCYRSPVTGKINCGSTPASQDSWAPSTEWSWVSKKLTEDLFITNRSEGTCLSVQNCSPDDSGRYDCYGGTAVKMKSCQSSSNQIWKHDLRTKRLFSKKAGEHFCLSWRSEQLTLEHCLPGGASSQQWYFARGKGYGTAEWGLLRFFAHGLKDPYPYLKGLLPPGQHDPRHDRAALPTLKIEYEPLYWSEEGEDCGFHPVTGAEGKRCFK